MQKIGVQVNGKARGVLEIPVDADEDAAVAAAKGIPAVERAIGDATIRKVIYIPKKILNTVGGFFLKGQAHAENPLLFLHFWRFNE